MKEEKTIVSKIIQDEVTGKERIIYYYAAVKVKDGVAVFHVDDSRPLSEEEVNEFNKRNRKT